MTNTVLISIVVAISAIALIMAAISLVMKFQELSYLKRIVTYGRGLADIHARMKEMMLEHHTLMDQSIGDAKEEILRHVTYTNRWQKVIAKMIKVGGIAPLDKATGTETVEDAEKLHEIGLDIAKVAFEDKRTIEEEKPKGE